MLSGSLKFAIARAALVSLAAAGPAVAQALPAGYDGPPPPAPPEVIARDGDGRLTIRAVRVAAPLRIDGTLDDEIYANVPPMSGLVQAEPQSGEPSPERTELWIAFDEDNFYLAVRCWETDSSRRVATDMRRDSAAMFAGDDLVTFFIDSYYDRRTGMGFTLNSIGGRNDCQQTTQACDRDWNPVWNFAVGSFEGGWTAEAAIPFRSIRYRQGREQVWGFNMMRAVRWRNEISVLSPIPQGLVASVTRHPTHTATVVGIEAPPAARNIDVKPYAIGTLSSSVAAVPRVSNDVDRDAGLDVKYGITPNLVADFTLNTDFAQVEADEQQVNLTRFSLFFPEKRDFFLENEGLFHFGGITTGGGDPPTLFYSRRIGLEAGRPVPIAGGGRLTGRAGRYSIGAINIHTDPSAATATARDTNFTVLRLKRDLLRRSSVGMLFTGRSVDQSGGGANLAVGLDGVFTFFDHLSVNTYWARTDTPGRRGNDTSYRGHLDYAGDRYGVQIERLSIGEDFNPEVGFVRRVGIEQTRTEFRFSPRPRRYPSIRRLVWSGAVDYFEVAGGRVDSRERVGEFAIEFQSDDRLSVVYTNAYEFLPSPFRIASDARLPVGGYSWDTVRLAYSIGQQRRITANLSLDHGTFYNGDRTAVTVGRGRVNVSPQLSFEPTYTLNNVDLRQGSFTSHLAGSRIVFTMSPRMFVSTLVQYNSGINAVSTNARFRWEYQPGSDLFVVYNDERDTRARAFPAMTTRAFVIKVNRLFRF